MKNYTFSFLFLVAFVFSTATFTSCSSGCDESQADADAERISELSLEYINDISNDEKCQAFVDAVRDFVNDYRDCDDVDQSDIAQIEASIEGLPCA